jgi:hypothetical protein
VPPDKYIADQQGCFFFCKKNEPIAYLFIFTIKVASATHTSCPAGVLLLQEK